MVSAKDEVNVLDRAAAFPAGFDVEMEDALYSLRSGNHGPVNSMAVLGLRVELKFQRNDRFSLAISTDRRNTRIKSLCRCLIAQRLSRALVQLPGHGV
jgi:hypothetical protein